jgi:hypothetical protein
MHSPLIESADGSPVKLLYLSPKTKYITAINKNKQVNAIATFYSLVCYNTYALIIVASIRVRYFCVPKSVTLAYNSIYFSILV